MLGISTTDRALKHLLCYLLLVFRSDKIPSLRCLCKLQRKPFSFLTNAVLFLLVDKTIVWELSTREIGLSAAEKYSLAERRNTVLQSGEIQIIARLLSVGGPPRMTECLVGADTRVAAGVYNSLATQLQVIVVLITIITIITNIIIRLSIGQRPCLC